MKHIRPAVVFALAAVGAAQTQLPPAIQDGFRIGGSRYGQWVAAIGTDSSGNVYLAGVTEGAPLPGTQASLGPQGGSTDLFVVKVAPGGKRVLYVTAIGGSREEYVGGMVVDRLGNVYLAGMTYSSDFPTTPYGYQTTASHGGAFLLKLDSSGRQLIFSTYLDDSGQTAARGLAIGSGGYIYVAGTTDGATFPTTPGAYLRSRTGKAAGFVSKFSPDGKYLAASTLSGDSSYVELASAVAVDPAGTVHIAGTTSSTSFPATPGAFRSTFLPNTGSSGYLARFDRNLAELRYATLVDSDGLAVQADPHGSSYVAGGHTNLMVEKFDVSGLRRYATLIAATNSNFAGAMVTLDDGSVYVGGGTSHPGFPTRDTLQTCYWGWPRSYVPSDYDALQFSTNAVLARLDPAGNVAFSSFLGRGPLSAVDALARDDSGVVYVAGRSFDTDFLGANLLDASTPGNLFAFRLDQNAIVQGRTAPACPAAGAIVPGMVSTVFGSNLGPATGMSAVPGVDGRYPAELAGTRVTVNGLNAPLLYVQDGQINYAVPQAVTGSTAEVCVTGAAGSACVTGRVGPFWLTLFSDNSGHNIWNQDGTANSPANPAARGSVVTVWGTGFGPYASSLPDGTLVQSDIGSLVYPVTSYILPPEILCPSGEHCPPGPAVDGVVEYAGMAPWSLFGVTQINIRIPEDAIKSNTAIFQLTVMSGDTPAATLSTNVATK